jgi:hypothetical protein
MEKPIIATTFSGLFVTHEPWDKAHVLWLKTAAERLKDPSIMDWANRPDYFNCVDGIMKRLSPESNEKQRVIKAREMYFDSVCEYVKQNPKVRNESVIKQFSKLKNDYRIALITTNTGEALKKILRVTNLEGFFDIIETSLPEEKDDKRIVFERFIEKYGKPLIYLGGNRKDSFDYCRENNINCVFTNLEGLEDISGVESVHNPKELKQKLENL